MWHLRLHKMDKITYILVVQILIVDRTKYKCRGILCGQISYKDLLIEDFRDLV